MDEDPEQINQVTTTTLTEKIEPNQPQVRELKATTSQQKRLPHKDMQEIQRNGQDMCSGKIPSIVADLGETSHC